jgi:hypothetical protein
MVNPISSAPPTQINTASATRNAFNIFSFLPFLLRFTYSVDTHIPRSAFR